MATTLIGTGQDWQKLRIGTILVEDLIEGTQV